MTEAGDDLDQDVVLATTDLVGRTGARELTYGYLHDDVPIDRAGWWAKASYRGAVIMVDNQPSVEHAMTALAERILSGAQCQRCGGLIQLRDGPVRAFPDAPRPDGVRWSKEEIDRARLCRWTRQGSQWEPGCVLAPEGQDEIHTAERLARALEELDDPRLKPMVWRARRGYYHDYLSPLTLPEHQLVADLRQHGLTQFAQRVIDGEFNASTAEANAWVASDEGVATAAEFAELFTLGMRQQQQSPPASHRSPPRSPSGADFWRAPRKAADLLCNCNHSGTQHLGGTGRCRGTDSYGLACECTSLEKVDDDFDDNC